MRNLDITVNAWTKNGTHLALTNTLRLLWLVTPISLSNLHSPSSFALSSFLKTRPRLKHNLSFSGATASIVPVGPSFRLSKLIPVRTLRSSCLFVGKLSLLAMQYWVSHCRIWSSLPTGKLYFHCLMKNLLQFSLARWIQCIVKRTVCNARVFHRAKTISFI